MAIPLSRLRYYTDRYTRSAFMSIQEAQRAGIQTAFLSHSHKDAELAKGVQGFLKRHGWDVYIDWEDATMPDNPNRETAKKLQKRIQDCDWFLYLATANSSESRWCPWEIGYADSEKGKDRLLILPTADERGAKHGNEYLELYSRIDYNSLQEPVVFKEGYYYHHKYTLKELNEKSLVNIS